MQVVRRHCAYTKFPPQRTLRNPVSLGSRDDQTVKGVNNRDLNGLSLPLSYQICCRYLRGLDLDFSRDLVEAVRNGVIDGIHYLVLAHAVEGGERPPSTQAMEVNTRHMIRIATMEGPSREGSTPDH